MRYYDSDNRQLVYIEENATPEFWDRQWEDEKLKKNILAGSNDRFVYPFTKKYLKKGSKILEGGCGKGQFVYSLYSRGYEAHGIDFAEKIIQKASQAVPELKLSLGDVRKLNFPDNTYDGYWSLGVIEHFPDGYDAIAKEMRRVLRPGGYLFLTFPYMSPLRRFKAWVGCYPVLKTLDREHFYQFALNHKNVISHFETLGFRLMEKRPYDGFKGLKDESGPFKPLFQSLYNNKSFFAQGIGFILSRLFAPLSGHAVLLIFKKK